MRSNLRDSLNIAPGATTFVDGEQVGEDHVLEEGETLEFLRPVGRKGVGRVWTVEQFCDHFQITVEQFEQLLGLGLRPLRWPDGAIRLCEDQVDRFLDQHLGLVQRPLPVPPEFLSPQDAAAFLGITSEALDHLRKARKIRAVQVGNQRGFVYAIVDLRDFASSRIIPTAEEELRKRGRGRR
ncbi:helix-turn-helix domain-containing protein [Tautonia plasticadhaerens]|uniref:Helix-turn-helix domain protein n=1 Tax=Tautonia plasticadhaerens TaxID=2527974 RepID=A0A518H4G9_9BACT|nr:helix-turn-helix domain-containing protein [Tautonia plasticadhaerens]QDV35717.1 hypothetical protein ElP_36220 [Tautonia plasticadhaerens]